MGREQGPGRGGQVPGAGPGAAAGAGRGRGRGGSPSTTPRGWAGPGARGGCGGEAGGPAACVCVSPCVPAGRGQHTGGDARRARPSLGTATPQRPAHPGLPSARRGTCGAAARKAYADNRGAPAAVHDSAAPPEAARERRDVPLRAQGRPHSGAGPLYIRPFPSPCPLVSHATLHAQDPKGDHPYAQHVHSPATLAREGLLSPYCHTHHGWTRPAWTWSRAPARTSTLIGTPPIPGTVPVRIFEQLLITPVVKTVTAPLSCPHP